MSAISERTEKWLKTIGYYAAFVAFGLATAVLGATLPGLAEHTQTDLSEISLIFTARSLGFLIGAFLGGRLYDRFPGHPVMAGVLIMIVIMLALIPLMSLLWLLIGLILVLGVASGMVEVGGNTLLVWVHRQNLGPFMNGLHFFFGLGAFLAPIIIARAVVLRGDITWAYWVMALLIAPIAIWLFYLPGPTIRSVSENGQNDRIKYLPVLFISLLFLLYAGAEHSFGGWIYTYTVTLGLSNEARAAYLTSAFWGALTIGRLVAIPLSARFKPRVMLLLDFVGCLVSISIILLGSTSLTALWIGTLGTGLSMASIFPMLVAFAERRIKITGKVNGLFFTGAGLGGMTLPWLIGQLFESLGPQATMVAILFDLIIAVSFFAILVLQPIHKKNI